MSYVYRLHSIFCVLLLSEGSNLHVASLIAALMVMCFLGVLTSMRLIFRVFFSLSVCFLEYMSTFSVAMAFVAGGTWPFSHGAAGLIHVIRTHGF